MGRACMAASSSTISSTSTRSAGPGASTVGRRSGATSPPAPPIPTGHRSRCSASCSTRTTGWRIRGRSCARTCCCISPTARCCSCCFGNSGAPRWRIAGPGKRQGLPAITTPPRCGTARRRAVAAASAVRLHDAVYIVQRETMLAAMFVLLGLLAGGHGARCSCRRRAGTLWMCAGIGFGTLLAMACKPTVRCCPFCVDARRDGVRRNARIADGEAGAMVAAEAVPACCCPPTWRRSCAQWSLPQEARPDGPSASAFTDRACCWITCACCWCRACCPTACTTTTTHGRPAYCARRRCRRCSRSPRWSAPVHHAQARAGAGGRLAVLLRWHLLESPRFRSNCISNTATICPRCCGLAAGARALVRFAYPGRARAARSPLFSCWPGSPRPPGNAPRLGRPATHGCIVGGDQPGSSRAIATQALFAMQAQRPDLAMAASRRAVETSPGRPATGAELHQRGVHGAAR